MMDCTINNCSIMSRVTNHRQGWYKVFAFSHELDYLQDFEAGLVAKFRHEGDAYRYAIILQQNPGNIRIVVIK